MKQVLLSDIKRGFPYAFFALSAVAFLAVVLPFFAFVMLASLLWLSWTIGNAIRWHEMGKVK